MNTQQSQPTPEPIWISIPKPQGPLTGREEIKHNGRWVNASTLPNYDDNESYEWRVAS